jgi:GH24 family phage-related lysozyme (muramidase)
MSPISGLSALLLAGTLSASVSDDLQRLEGFSSTSYVDTTGNLTVGFGHKISKSVSMSRETALTVLADDIAIAERGARRAFPSIDSHSQEVRDVLVMMTYQLGSTSCAKFVKFGKAIAAHDYAAASREMLSSRWHQQTPKRCEELARKINHD